MEIRNQSFDIKKVKTVWRNGDEQWDAKGCGACTERSHFLRERRGDQASRARWTYRLRLSTALAAPLPLQWRSCSPAHWTPPATSYPLSPTPIASALGSILLSWPSCDWLVRLSPLLIRSKNRDCLPVQVGLVWFGYEPFDQNWDQSDSGWNSHRTLIFVRILNEWYWSKSKLDFMGSEFLFTPVKSLRIYCGQYGFSYLWSKLNSYIFLRHILYATFCGMSLTTWYTPFLLQGF